MSFSLRSQLLLLLLLWVLPSSRSGWVVVAALVLVVFIALVVVLVLGSVLSVVLLAAVALFLFLVTGLSGSQDGSNASQMLLACNRELARQVHFVVLSKARGDEPTGGRT